MPYLHQPSFTAIKSLLVPGAPPSGRRVLSRRGGSGLLDRDLMVIQVTLVVGRVLRRRPRPPPLLRDRLGRRDAGVLRTRSPEISVKD